MAGQKVGDVCWFNMTCAHGQEIWYDVPLDERNVPIPQGLWGELEEEVKKLSVWRREGLCVTCGRKAENVVITVTRFKEGEAPGPGCVVINWPTQEVMEIGLPGPLHELLNQAKQASQAGRKQESIATCDELLAQHPKYYYTWYVKGMNLQGLGQAKESIACFERAIQIRPRAHEAWCSKGNSLLQLNQFQLATENYEKAIELKPGYAFAWNNLGVALEKLGRNEDAIPAYEKALEIDRAYAQARSNLDGVRRRLGKT